MPTFERISLTLCFALACQADDEPSAEPSATASNSATPADSATEQPVTTDNQAGGGGGGGSAPTGDATNDDGGESGEDSSAPPRSSNELFELSDEFEDEQASQLRWTFRHEDEREDAQYQSFSFDDDGQARMVPTRGGWYGAFKGPYLFQLVEGDFMMEARVLAHRTGSPDQPPNQAYNSAGLLIRNPTTGADAEENWVLHHLGMHDPEGTGVGVERKITRSSNSELDITTNDFRGRIRICRVGDQIMLTRQLDDENSFSVSASYQLPLDSEVQAGFSLTAWNSRGVEPDLSRDGDVVGVWDYVRYYRISDTAACMDEVE